MLVGLMNAIYEEATEAGTKFDSIGEVPRKMTTPDSPVIPKVYIPEYFLEG